MRKFLVTILCTLMLSALPTALTAEPAAAANTNPTYLYIKSVAGEKAAKRYAWHVEQAAKKYHLDPLLVARVIRLESSFNPREVSPVGAVGLMQVMPFHFRHGHIPRSKWMQTATNLDLGCRILSWYKERMKRLYPDLDPLALRHRALVAYNMGPRAVVSRGIYRSRYSEIIMKHYVPRSVQEAKAKEEAAKKAAAEAALHQPRTAAEVVYKADRPEELPSMSEVNRVAEEEMAQSPESSPSVRFFW